MDNNEFEHGIPDNPYNKHAWIVGEPEIGKGVWIGAFCLIDALYAPLKIGKGCDISSGTQILTHSTVRRCISERKYNAIDADFVEIGDYCFIGSNVTILMGAKIGHHSVIAAGAVIPQGASIPPYSLVVGVPGKVVGSSKKFLKKGESESISVVIPAYNEGSTIEGVIKEAVLHLEELTKKYEIVVVNDGSTDQTKKIVENLIRKNKKIRLISHLSNKGFTGAMKTSFKSAKNQLVFLAPGDGQFDFSQFGSFVDAIKGYDVAVGYRTESEEKISRKFNSKLFHFLCRILLNIKLREISTVSLWRKSILNSITITSSDRSAMFLPEIIHKAIRMKVRFNEVPIHWNKRKGGEAKGANPQVILKTLGEMFRLWYKTIS